LSPQSQPFYGFAGQQAGTPYFDPNNPAFQQQAGTFAFQQQQPSAFAPFQQQQQGAFAPYQQPNFYDPAAAAAFAGPYGYMPAAY